MTNRLEVKLQLLKSASKKALVVYLTAGYPSARETVKLAALLEKSGADILEIGVPFSDPIADGKTVQYASHLALENGMSLSKVFELVEKIRKNSDIPIVLMGYLNPFMRHGLKNSLARAGKSGVDGFIIPDVIPEESGEIRKICGELGLSLVLLASPNTPDKRLKVIDAASRGFVYVVSVAGVTGARKQLPSTTRAYLINTEKWIKKNPRIIGFGISGASQVRKLKPYVDGVIVASALIEIIRKSGNLKAARAGASSFIRSLRRALDN